MKNSYLSIYSVIFNLSDISSDIHTTTISVTLHTQAMFNKLLNTFTAIINLSRSNFSIALFELKPANLSL
jgi:hypothetical protein